MAGSASVSHADWCFERRAQLPPEWTAVDTATTEKRAREFLQKRFEDCYPFHPATISVFQRKWQTLSQFQQTRGTLAMLAQWISWAFREGFTSARREPLITLGSAPLEVAEFRGVVLGQLGEARLGPAIETDIFELTQAVVRHDSRVALQRLESLLAEGQAAQQILALLLWQFRVLLFASAMRTSADAERMAKAIRSSAYAIGKWQAFARRVARADVIRAYEVLYATDLAIKTGRMEPAMAMTLCILDPCGTPAADPRELVVGEPPRR